MLKLLLIVGARPNFMKVAPLVDAIRARSCEFASVLVHTGQHYDAEMSDAFFRDLNLPTPDCHLEVGSGSHARQTAEVMLRFEPILLAHRPDWVVVVGDVNSTLACALVASKLHIRIAHIEAGLRSRDRRMPEEVNRILTDQVSDLLLTPSEDAGENLLREGIPAERIRLVGNIMIDALRTGLERAAKSNIRERLGVSERPYGVVTLHRPSNTDDPTALAGILSALENISGGLPLVFPVHPRTRHALDELQGADSLTANPNLHFTPPLGYLDFLKLMSGARLVLTDSGGLQEETTALGIPCLTLRENTERPITVSLGTNRVVGTDTERIISVAHEVLDACDARSDSSREMAHPFLPPMWDGKTADRILDALMEHTRTTSPRKP